MRKIAAILVVLIGAASFAERGRPTPAPNCDILITGFLTYWGLSENEGSVGLISATVYVSNNTDENDQEPNRVQRFRFHGTPATDEEFGLQQWMDGYDTIYVDNEDGIEFDTNKYWFTVFSRNWDNTTTIGSLTVPGQLTLYNPPLPSAENNTQARIKEGSLQYVYGPSATQALAHPTDNTKFRLCVFATFRNGNNDGYFITFQAEDYSQNPVAFAFLPESSTAYPEFVPTLCVGEFMYYRWDVSRDFVSQGKVRVRLRAAGSTGTLYSDPVYIDVPAHGQ